MYVRLKLLILIIPVILILAIAGGCALRGQIMDGDGMVNSYHQISQDEAKELMEADNGSIIVDVRRWDEYNEGHIPGAVCIPNEEITDARPEELPDLNQIILIYCRSGRRSKEAAQKLFDMGYTNIYEFGGIIDWTGEIVKEETDMGEDFNMDPIAYPVVYINGVYFSVEYEDNSSAEAFLEKIKEEPLTIEMHDYANFEKVGDLPWELPTNDEKITTEPGDIILYQGDQITVYYDENTYTFTKLGHLEIDDIDAFRNLLGTGNATIEFSVEWTE